MTNTVKKFTNSSGTQILKKDKVNPVDTRQFLTFKTKSRLLINLK